MLSLLMVTVLMLSIRSKCSMQSDLKRVTLCRVSYAECPYSGCQFAECPNYGCHFA